MDMDFEPVKEHVGLVEINTTATREHVGEIERFVRTVKEHTMCIVSSFHFNSSIG